MNKAIKIAIVYLIIIFLIIFPITVYASEGEGEEGFDFSWEEINGRAHSFITSNTTQDFQAENFVNGAANILTTIGVVIVFIGILVMGINYMVATPEEAAKLKVKLVGLIIAGIIILGAYAIWRFVGDTLSDMVQKIGEGTPTPTATATEEQEGGSTPTPKANEKQTSKQVTELESKVSADEETQIEKVINPSEEQNIEDEPEQEDFEDSEDLEEGEVTGASKSSEELLNEVSLISNASSSSTEITKITLNRKTVSLYVGAKFKLKYSLKPDGIKTKNITFTSENPAVATVSKGGTIKAKKAGTTRIKVTSENGIVVKAKVIVSENKIKPESIALNISSAELSLEKKQTVKLKYSISPIEANYKNEVSYASKNEKIATVSSEGVVTPKSEGTTTITAKTENGKTAKVKITVKGIPEKDRSFKGYIAEMDSWLYIPPLDVVKTYKDIPLIIYLRGGLEQDKSKREDSTFIVESLPKYLNGGMNVKAIVVAPRVANADIIGLIDNVKKYGENKSIKINENKISITGYSTGATWALIRASNEETRRIFSACVVVAFQNAGYYSRVYDIKCPARFLFELRGGPNSLQYKENLKRTIRDYVKQNPDKDIRQYEKDTTHGGILECYKGSYQVNEIMPDNSRQKDQSINIIKWMIEQSK